MFFPYYFTCPDDLGYSQLQGIRFTNFDLKFYTNFFIELLSLKKYWYRFVAFRANYQEEYSLGISVIHRKLSDWVIDRDPANVKSKSKSIWF